MKQSISLAILLMAINTLYAQTVIYTETFETDGEGSRYTSNTFLDCPNSDFFLRTNTNPVTPGGCGQLFGTALTNLQGSFFWASEDIRASAPTPGARPPGSLTTQAINVTNFNNLTVSLYLATSNNNNARWESSDSLNIQASFNGVNYFTVGRFMGKGTPVVGARLGIDGNLNGVYEAGVDPATDCDVANFTLYTFSIPGTGNNLFIRLDFDQLGGTEEMAIDHIQVSGVSTLPVKLVSFTAAKNSSNEVRLNWQVSDAADAAGFDVEQSTDGRQFVSLQRIPSNSGSHYSYIHQPADNINYYRLRIIDHDGRHTFSQVLKIVSDVSPGSLQIYPNPVGASLQVVQSSDRRRNGSYVIYDASGKPVHQWSVIQQQGNNTYSFPVTFLPAGQYSIAWMEEGVKKISRLFIKQ